jgi:hypothetical protein
MQINQATMGLMFPDACAQRAESNKAPSRDFKTFGGRIDSKWLRVDGLEGVNEFLESETESLCIHLTKLLEPTMSYTGYVSPIAKRVDQDTDILFLSLVQCLASAYCNYR